MAKIKWDGDMHGYDTVVECKKCGRRQFLNFVDGLKNGWSLCCGEAMLIIKTTANIGKAVEETLRPVKVLKKTIGL